MHSKHNDSDNYQGKRQADVIIEESQVNLTKRLSLVANKKIKLWKALLIIVFVAGFATALAWTVSTGSGMPSFAATASCFTDPLWSEEYCTKNCQCDLSQGDCDNDEDCKSGYCAQNAGQKYGQKKSMDVCEAKPDWACQETDDGQDYYKKGITSYKGQSKTDYCKNKTNLKEYYCKSATKIGDNTFKCPDGCQDGACVNKDEKKCVQIFGDSSISTSMNIFFVGAGYNQNQIFCTQNCDLNIFDKVLENDINRFLFNENKREGFGLLTIEPFKSNLDKVNVFMLSDPYNCDYINDPYCYFNPTVENMIKQSCGSYTPNNPIYVIIGYDDPATFSQGGWGRSTISASHRKGSHDFEDVVSVFIHEIGHNFGLWDNYGEAYRSWEPPYIMLDSYSIPNCDNTPGCPKWCSGTPLPAPDDDCVHYLTEETCKEHSQPQTCLWLPEKDPYFDSYCIKNDDLPGNPNIGTDCLSETGCYWGCYGAGYRPASQNNFADRFTQRIDENGKKHTYEPVSERFIRDIFSCCYPKSCLDYDRTYCSDFATRYGEYGSCNLCSF